MKIDSDYVGEEQLKLREDEDEESQRQNEGGSTEI